MNLTVCTTADPISLPSKAKQKHSQRERIRAKTLKRSWRVLHDEDFSIMSFQDCWVLKVRKLCCHLNFPIPVGALGIKCQGHWKFYPNPSLGCGTEDLTLDTLWNENAIMTFSWCYSSPLSPFCTAEKAFLSCKGLAKTWDVLSFTLIRRHYADTLIQNGERARETVA